MLAHPTQLLVDASQSTPDRLDVANQMLNSVTAICNLVDR